MDLTSREERMYRKLPPITWKDDALFVLAVSLTVAGLVTWYLYFN